MTTEELERELAFARFLLDSVNTAIFRWRPDGTIITLNEYGQQLFGFTGEEIAGQHLVGTMIAKTETSGRDLAYMVTDIVTNPERYAFNENENTRKDGSLIWLIWRNTPVIDTEGGLQEIVSCGVDITQRKQMEVDLQNALSMSAPIIQISKGVLLLPLVGIVDSTRARQIQAACLDRIADTQAKVCILDISGVAVMDAGVAQHLLKIMRAARLMGCQGVMSGMSPSSAEAIIQLGIDISEIETTGTLMDALTTVLR